MNLEHNNISERYFCLFLTTYYQNFIESHYRKNPHLLSDPYRNQLNSLLLEFLGDSDFYSKGLKKAGWKAEDVIVNCQPLQQTWALENDFSGNTLEISFEQELIVGQMGTIISKKIPFELYDIIFSSLPYYVEQFRRSGLASYYQPLAFAPRILEHLNTVPYHERQVNCSFVGGISNLHTQSYELLEVLAKETPTDFWGYGTDTLPQDSAIHSRHHGEVWGKDMFAVLSSSKLTINRHGDLVKNYAANMRLFEATGCGSLLLTEYKDNLNELFEIGKEVIAYRSPEECAALVKYYLANPKEAEEIAIAGQERTLRDHTYIRRMEQTAEILERHLRYKREKDRFPVPDMSKISYGYALIQPNQVSGNMTSAWKSEEIPAKQRALVQQSLNNMYKGKISPADQSLLSCLSPYAYPGCSILEIGCSSGYYYEILEYLLNKRISYTGVDYSEPLINMAKDYYPKAKFHVADGANLPFKNEEFFVAISSCILLHVPNYQEHIKETVRVAKCFVIAHRTPVCRQRPTQYLKKFQYDVTYIFEKREVETGNRKPETGSSQPISGNQQPATDKPMLLNLGCGHRHHQDWINIDVQSTGPGVRAHSLYAGIPFPDEAIDVVYHSHVLEHFPKRFTPIFLKDCHRVLKPGGIIRVIVPDLERIMRTYIDLLERSLQGDIEAQKRYEWIMLELFDQMVRNQSGGDMLEYWKQQHIPAEDFVIERCGSEAKSVINSVRNNPSANVPSQDIYLQAIRNKDASLIQRIGLFRISGEIHQWMYDRYSLTKLLHETGFTDIKVCRADESAIPNFNSYLLDIEPDGKVRKPDSLFMEARKLTTKHR